jgi:hypothetical protein
MRRTLTLVLGVALFGIMAAVVVASQGADDPAGAQGTTVTETVEHTRTVEDNPKRQNRRANDDSPAQGVDVSGPCDEAEHANDPRCTGQPTTAPRVDDNPGAHDNGGRVDDNPGADDNGGRVDNSGPGSVNSGGDDGVDHDRGDDHGGDNEVEHHGGGDDDSGGHGGGDDDDNSGHGGGGDDD